ncbi:MAG: HAD-IB family hydrolase [Rubrivivax sp.]|nr:MAG: HAD-IB family hydrolase [Rubrivivax sp.]
MSAVIQHQAPQAQRTVAVFDFDGTVSDRHTFWRYLRFIATPPIFWLSVLTLLPYVVGVLVGRVQLMTAREAFIRRFLGGLTVAEEADYARRFIQGPLKAWIRPAALRRLAWHRSQGHLTLLVSNAPENYLISWGLAAGFDVVCGTRLAVSGGRLTGGLQGTNCVNEEKVRRLKAVVSDLDHCFIYAYGDSDGDHELLAIADRPFYRNWY